MNLFDSNIQILIIMVIYGVVSGGSAIILKVGIFRAGGIRIDNFFRDILPTIWKLLNTPIWFLGGITAVIGFLIYTIALNSYDVSIVKPLVNTNLLFTFIFAAIFFKETLSKIEWLGIGFLITGLLLFAFSPNVESTNEINIPLLLVFLPLTICLIGIMVVILFVLKRRDAAEFILPIFAGFFFGLGTFFTKSLLISLNHGIQTEFPQFFLISYSFSMFILTYTFAIIAQQLAFEQGRLSVVSPITNAVSVIIAFLGAYFVFYEDLFVKIPGITFSMESYFKILGIVFILIALFILRREVDPLKNQHSFQV